jgi:hypothetical protein
VYGIIGFLLISSVLSAVVTFTLGGIFVETWVKDSKASNKVLLLIFAMTMIFCYIYLDSNEMLSF